MPTTIKTKAAPAAIGPYAQGMAAGNLIFVSGQLGLDPDTGDFKGDDLASQTRQAIENLSAILQAGNSSLQLVAAVDVYLTDMNDFAEFNAIYEGYFTDHKPARAVVEVSALPKNGRVEIKCVACREPSPA